MASVLERYLHKIREATAQPGVYAYRGQSRAEWSLHSAATRRLTKSLGDSALNAPWFSKVYVDYHRETLVDAARTRGFGVEAGRDISDLQLLAKLQHFGAATGLLDFTWSPLIALWFASRETDSDGKLFVVNANEPIHVAKLPSDPERQTIDDVFSRADNAPGLLYWEPMWSGDAEPRILRQRGVFIIGRPLIPSDGHIIEEIEISKEDKASLLAELKLLDVSEASLFPDIYGFSTLEGATASTHVRTSHFYLIQGNQHYQAGNYIAAIAAYDSCISRSPGVGELYFLRGNAKSAAKLFSEAVGDYRQTIVFRHQPILGLGHTENSAVFESLVFMALFNCGNALAELSDYEAALVSYSEAIQLEMQRALGKEQALFNRGNTYLDLVQFDEAINDYNEVLSLQANLGSSRSTLFNKGNALVMLGQFNEALKCYRMPSLTEWTESMVQNSSSLEQVIEKIGNRAHTVHLEKESNFGGLMRVSVYVEGHDGKDTWNIVFKGREGNIGNFGWGFPGGEGFEGKMGFVVTLEKNNQRKISQVDTQRTLEPE